MNSQRNHDSYGTEYREKMMISMERPAGWKKLNVRQDTFSDFIFAASWILGLLAAFCFLALAIYHGLLR